MIVELFTLCDRGGAVNRYDDFAKVLGPLPEQPALSLDAGYDYRPVHADLDARGITAKIAKRGEQTRSKPTDGGS